MDRSIGFAVLVVGLLVLLGGLGWAYKQYQDEESNNDSPGPFNDPDESKENAGNGLNGLWLAAAGFAIAIVGTVLLVMGARSRASA